MSVYMHLNTVEKLANCGAKMVVISNSSRRASTTIEKLSSLGFNPSLFLGAITSGELTHQYLLRFSFPEVLHLYYIFILEKFLLDILLADSTVA